MYRYTQMYVYIYREREVPETHALYLNVQHNSKHISQHSSTLSLQMSTLK
jgi:hypothetical protein